MDAALEGLDPEELAEELERRAYYRALGTQQLADEALSFSSSEDEVQRALDELHARNEADHWAVLLALSLSVDAEEEFRYSLLRVALSEGGLVEYCAWWLTIHEGYETYESPATRDRVGRAISDLERGEVPRARAMVALLANRHLSDRLRAQAGLELADDLGDAAHVLMHHHLGADLVPALEELCRRGHLDATHALESMALDADVSAERRIEAAQAAADTSDYAADDILARLATAPGLTWNQRFDVLERAVAVADSRAATAALALLGALLSDAPAPSDEAISRELQAMHLWR